MSDINPAYFGRAEELADKFRNGHPYPHLALDNFLSNGLAESLFEGFPRATPNGALKITNEDIKSIGAPYLRFDELIASSEFRELISRITGIPDLQYDPAYLGGGTHENFQGSDLSPHIDFNYHTNGLHRRLSMILYLNKEWQPEWGGNLEFFKSPWEQEVFSSVSPLWNRLVIFPTTEWSWHGFQRMNIPEGARVGSRKSIAFFYYSEKRPAHETKALHGTVYYERPLPKALGPGKTIHPEDWRELKRLTKRRDDLIKMLYEREILYSSLTGDLRRQVRGEDANALKAETRKQLAAALSALRGNSDGPLRIEMPDMFDGSAKVSSGVWKQPFCFRGCDLQLSKPERVKFRSLVACPSIDTDGKKATIMARVVAGIRGTLILFQYARPHFFIRRAEEIEHVVDKIWDPLGAPFELNQRFPLFHLGKSLFNLFILLAKIIVARLRRGVAIFLPRACPVCGRSIFHKQKKLGILSARDFHLRKNFTLLECRDCSVFFLSPAPTARQLRHLYSGKRQFNTAEYSDERASLAQDFYRSRLRALEEKISRVPASVLEVGAGMSWLCRASKAMNPDCKTVAQDISAEARDSCPWVQEYLVGDLAAQQSRLKELGPFDLISLTHVVEHLRDPVPVLRTLRKFLRKDGVIFLTMPHRPAGSTEFSLEAWKSWSYNHVPEHLQYFNRQSLMVLAKRAGLRIAFYDDTSESGQAMEVWLEPESQPNAARIFKVSALQNDAVK